jgi:hypothetical protein
MAEVARIETTAFSPVRDKPLLAIGAGGLIAGTLDLTYAIAVYSPHRPILVPQTIASGVLGMKAYEGGMQTAILGVFLHFVIALGAATVFYVASRQIAFMTEHAVVSGLIFGALVYAFMHVIVLPLSEAPHGHSHLFTKVCEFVWHWFGVGLPIAISVRRYACIRGLR